MRRPPAPLLAAHGCDAAVSAGATWQAAVPQQPAHARPSRFRSYGMPIPAGTRTVRSRGERGAGGASGWLVRDASVWIR